MAQNRVCAIEGCGKVATHRGWCSAHYAMWKKRGDPQARTLVKYGAPLAWLRAHVDHKGTDCLIWPFGGNGNGYGQVRFDGRSRFPHRLMCEWANGAPPTPLHQAAHACGNRQCVNPGHLRWRDQSGNEVDKVAHGRDIRGERHPIAKLTEADVRKIRALDGLETHCAIAAQFGISSVHVHRIIKRTRWGWLE